jgi:hypothetical protein
MTNKKYSAATQRNYWAWLNEQAKNCGQSENSRIQRTRKELQWLDNSVPVTRFPATR